MTGRNIDALIFSLSLNVVAVLSNLVAPFLMATFALPVVGCLLALSLRGPLAQDDRGNKGAPICFLLFLKHAFIRAMLCYKSCFVIIALKYRR